jgi:hypothetical protein
LILLKNIQRASEKIGLPALGMMPKILNGSVNLAFIQKAN